MKIITVAKLVLVMLLLLSIQLYAIGQDKNKDDLNLTNTTLVGTKVPDYTFHRVKSYKTEFGADTVHLTEFLGKWLILYFWTRSCIPCVNTFPKLREIKSDNEGLLQVMLVGINDMYNTNTEAFYDGVRAVQKFSLPIAYDSTLVKQLGIIYSGTAVIVDPDGEIQLVCHGEQLSNKEVKAVIKRRRPKSK